MVKYLLMSEHKAEAIVITCIDFRFQEYINNWITENFKPKTFDRGAFAGASRSLATILSQIEVAERLHKIKKAVLINHEDCGAYGEKGHVDHHVRDLKLASKVIKAIFPKLKVKTYYLKLNGEFQPIV